MQATVSNLIVHESAWNIVPHNVELHIDIRDYQVSRKALYRRQLVEHVQTCCEKNGISFAWQEVSDSQPRNIDAELIVQLEKVVQKLGYSYRHLVSGAGHDAQMMNCPIAMIFVPSKHGKSHSPEELTADEFLEKGCEVLHQLVLELLSNDTGL